MKKIYGWPAKVISIKDESRSYQEAGTEITAELRLLPFLKRQTVPLGGEEIELSALLRLTAGKKTMAQLFFHNLKPGSHIIVNGDLSHRYYHKNTEEYSHLRTNLWMDEFLLDRSGGTVSPVVGYLWSSDKLEYAENSGARFSNYCHFCGKPNNWVAEENTRYCESCDAPPVEEKIAQ